MAAGTSGIRKGARGEETPRHGEPGSTEPMGILAWKTGLIRSGGLNPNGGWQVHDGRKRERPSRAPSVHRGVPGRTDPAGPRIRRTAGQVTDVAELLHETPEQTSTTFERLEFTFVVSPVHDSQRRLLGTVAAATLLAGMFAKDLSARCGRGAVPFGRAPHSGSLATAARRLASIEGPADRRRRNRPQIVEQPTGLKPAPASSRRVLARADVQFG